MKTKNYYESSAPVGDDWSKPFGIGKFNDRTWFISYLRNQQSEWVSIKVFSLERKKSKACFWLGHNTERFADGDQYKILIEYYPELLNAIEDYWFSG